MNITIPSSWIEGWRSFRAWVRGSPDIRDVPAAVRQWLTASPARRRALKRGTLIGVPVAAVLAAAACWMIWGPNLQPDFRSGPLKRVFNYTLLTEEFNRLPVEKRVELVGQLIERMKGMSQSDSVMVAAFAAGIAGEARTQLEKNASKLAIDLWDKFAVEYQTLAPADRDAFLDQSFVEFAKVMEGMAGETRRISDAERIAEAKRDAQRDMQRLRERGGLPTRAAARIFNVMNNHVAAHASPAQQQRGQLLIRDMTRRFRGESPGGR